MLAMTQAAVVPPFELSAFADPNGSFTAAAAMVAPVSLVPIEHGELAPKRRQHARNQKYSEPRD